MKSQSFVCALLLTAFALPCFLLNAAGKKDKDTDAEEFALAIFPAEGKINLKEGTVEAWVSLDYSHDNAMLGGRSFVTPMAFFAFEKDNTTETNDSDKESEIVDTRIMLATQQGANMVNIVRYMSTLMLVQVKDKKISGGIACTLEEFKWKKGEWHYLAATWKKTDAGYDIMFQIDEQRKTGAFPANEFMPDNLKEYHISIGNIHSAKGAVEALRVSGVVRTEEELGKSFKSGIAEDKSTLFFFDPKTLSHMKKSKYVDLKKLKASSKGTLVGPCKIIKGKFGKAVQFHD